MNEKDITICGHGSGNPSAKNLYTYTAQRYAKKAPNGKHKGVAAVMRLKAITDDGRARYVDAYSRIIGRNRYSQPRREYVDRKYKNGLYYSDCSSSQMWALQEAGFKTGGLLNTAGIYRSPLFEEIPVTIKDGHIVTPELLKVADMILYVGNDPKRPLQIGHVEGVFSVPDHTGEHYPGEYPELPPRGYFRRGDGIDALTDRRIDIKRVQRLVNWITGLSIAVDGKYGANTEKAVKQAQKVLKTAADGEFGKKTLAAAKNYTR